MKKAVSIIIAIVALLTSAGDAGEISNSTREQVIGLITEDMVSNDVPLAYSILESTKAGSSTDYDEWTVEELAAEIEAQNEQMMSASEMAESARILGIGDDCGTVRATQVFYDNAKTTRNKLETAMNNKIEESTYGSPIDMEREPLVRSEFGGRVDPISGKRAGHSGMDLAVPTDTASHAIQSGVVMKSEYHYSYGIFVKIDHGNGLCSTYAHNSLLNVKEGDIVAKGDVISLSGSTGRSTGPHLHFEMRQDNVRVNPRDYLPTTNTNTTSITNYSDPALENTAEC